MLVSSGEHIRANKDDVIDLDPADQSEPNDESDGVFVPFSFALSYSLDVSDRCFSSANRRAALVSSPTWSSPFIGEPPIEDID